jgi:hypothetical protein
MHNMVDSTGMDLGQQNHQSSAQHGQYDSGWHGNPYTFPQQTSPINGYQNYPIMSYSGELTYPWVPPPSTTHSHMPLTNTIRPFADCSKSMCNLAPNPAPNSVPNSAPAKASRQAPHLIHKKRKEICQYQAKYPRLKHEEIGSEFLNSC